MATFYFNGAVNGDWQNLSNWWMNDTFTTPATSLPTSADDVIAVARISTNSGSEPTVKNFTMNGDYTVELLISITVTGTATFNNIGGFYGVGVTVTGNCIFNDGSFLGGNVIGDCVLNSTGTSYLSTITGNIICNGDTNNWATINGNGTFNDTSIFNGVITGDCIFNDFARFSNYPGYGPFPSITGNCTFNDSSYATSDGLITGNCTFNDNSTSFGVNISGNATFNNNANVQQGSSSFPTVVTNGICTFNDSSANQAIVTGDCVFNDSSLNTGTVTEDATFNNYSMNTGSISGTATFTGQAANGGTAGTFVPASPPQILFFNAAVNNDWNNLNNWWTNVSCTIPATNLPTSVNSVIATSSILTNSGSNPTIVNLRMWTSRLNINITTTGLCLFITSGAYNGEWSSVTAYNSGTVTGNCLFLHNTYNTGTINGNATFYDDSFNVGTVSGNIISDGFNFYFNAAVDHDWQTLGNWWMDSDHTIPAISLPTSNDDVIMNDGIYYNSGSEPTVRNLTVADGLSLSISITVTNVATFNGTSLFMDATLTGNCVFNDTARNDYGIINGNCTFNDSSYNYGTITGDCTFNNSSYTTGIITGDCIFNNSSKNDFRGSITGDCIFNDSSQNFEAGITGNCTFNNSSENDWGSITGDCIFNDSSRHALGGSITGDCTFNNSSYNSGTITGDCTFNDTSYNHIEYYNFEAINGDCIFNHSSANGGRVNGDCIFSDSATNYRTGVHQWGGQFMRAGEVNGNCTFSLSGAAMHINSVLTYIAGQDSITGTIDFKYEKGINGSSILGIL